jgi:hypothetical protein
VSHFKDGDKNEDKPYDYGYYLEKSFNLIFQSSLPAYCANADNLALRLRPFAKRHGYDWHDVNDTAHGR